MTQEQGSSNVTTITNDSVVTLHFTIKMKDGSVADSTHNMGKPANSGTRRDFRSRNFVSRIATPIKDNFHEQ